MITYIPGKDERLNVSENLSFIVYTLVAALRKSGAPPIDIEDLEKLCAKHLNALSPSEQEVIERTIQLRFSKDIQKERANPLANSAELPDKDFIGE